MLWYLNNQLFEFLYNDADGWHRLNHSVMLKNTSVAWICDPVFSTNHAKKFQSSAFEDYQA